MIISKLFLPFIVLFTVGCTKIGPEFEHKNQQELPSAWDANLSQSDASIKDWWKIFNDETLNTLIEKMYEQNFDLKSAGLRILQARAALGISDGLRYPQVQTLSGSAAGVRQNGNNFASTGVNFDLGWEIDVWGKYARNIESAEATLYASVASYDDILVTLIAEVARNYINYTTAQERIAFAQSNIIIQKRVTKMTEVQYNAGNVSELDMQQSRTQLYATQAAIPNYELNMIQSRNALAILLAVLPHEIDSILVANKKVANQTEKDLFNHKNIPTFIPVAKLDTDFSVNADIVRRRPDIKVAQLQAQGQSARIGATEAELYPHFSLFGSLGLNINNATNSWTSASNAVGISAGPAFSWNIFQYDRIKNQVRIQDAKLQESLNNYNKTVLQAVQEVSNALNGYTLTMKQLEFNKKAIMASVRAFDISMIQYNNGMVDYQRLLSTVEKLIKQEDIYAVNKGSIATQVVLLYKALGGGWQMHNGNVYVDEKDASVMTKRTDWGDYLDSDNLQFPNSEKQ